MRVQDVSYLPLLTPKLLKADQAEAPKLALRVDGATLSQCLPQRRLLKPTGLETASAPTLTLALRSAGRGDPSCSGPFPSEPSPARWCASTSPFSSSSSGSGLRSGGSAGAAAPPRGGGFSFPFSPPRSRP